MIHPHGISVQVMPPLTQLLNIINLGMTLNAAEGGEIDGVKKEANGHPSNGPVDSKNDELTSGQEDQAPIGLGTGLAPFNLNCCTVAIMLIGKETPYLFMIFGMISNMASEPFVLSVSMMNNPVHLNQQQQSHS